MTTLEDSELLTYIKSKLTIENRNEEQLNFLKYFPSIIYGFDLNEKKLELFNQQRFSNTLGFTVDDTHSWQDAMEELIYKDDRSAVQLALESFRQGKGQADLCFECRMNHKDGQFRYFKTMVTVLKKDNNGFAASLLIISEDITEITISGQSLTALKHLVEDTEQLMESCSWKWNRRSRELTCSDGIYGLLGYDKTQVTSRFTGEFIMSHVKTQDIRKLRAAMTQAISDKSDFDCCVSIITNNLKERIISSRGKMVVNEAGKVVQVIGISRDISHETKFNNHLHEHHELTLEKEEFLSQGSWEWNNVENSTSWSPGMYRLFGYADMKESDDLDINSRFLELHLADKLPGSGDSNWPTFFRDKKNFIKEFSIIDHCCVRKQLETFARIIEDPHSSLVKVIGTTRDVTRLRQYEQTLEEKISELKRSNKELEEFAYVASHDLQEPLRKLANFSERLQTKFRDKLGADGNLYLERIGVSTDNMKLLIENLLEFSRTARAATQFVNEDLNSLLNTVKSDLELKIEETGASIIHESLPAIEVIPSQIKQLFDNILNNAIKFRKKDHPSLIRVFHQQLSHCEKEELHLPVHKKYFKIVIEDNGIGFEKEYAEQIFKIFQRLHGKCEYPGSGIGLAICKKIAENHNGIIYAESVPEQGATFTIILPERQT